jgi:small-conductance mechanosensitive channel
MTRGTAGWSAWAVKQRIVALLAVFAALAFLQMWLAAALPASELADRAALQRQIYDAHQVAAEAAKAVPRVREQNRELRARLDIEARELRAVDISAGMLRAAGLDVDAGRSHLRTTMDRIERRDAEIELLQRQVYADSESGRQLPSELLAVSTQLVGGLRQLAQAEAEQLALVEERLAMLQERVELPAIRAQSGFEQEPQVAALRAIVSRQTRDGTRLANEAASIASVRAENALQKQLLELQADDAIARATQRLVDLDLLRIGREISILDELLGNRPVPLRVLRHGRQELGVLRARLDAQQRELAAERLALADRRELIHGQGRHAIELVEAHLTSVGGLEELLDFQQADIARLQGRIAESAERYDVEVGSRELQALAERRPLPIDIHHRGLLGSELAILPGTVVDQLRGLAVQLRARLTTTRAPITAFVAFSLAALCLLLWWLHRSGLRRLAANDPDGLESVPVEALRRTLPALLPVLAWLVVVLTVGLDARSIWLVAATLSLWPFTALLLHADDLLKARAAEVEIAASHGRGALIAAAVFAAIVMVAYLAPMLPVLANLLDRVAFFAVALTAIGTWKLRRSLIAALRGSPRTSPAWLRFLELLTLAVPGLLLLAAIAGLSGWVELGWRVAAVVGAVVAAIVLVLTMTCVLRAITLPLKARGETVAIDAVLRLGVIALAVGAAWLLVQLFTESSAVTATFWVLAIAAALPFVLQPVEALVEFVLQLDPEHRRNGSISVLAICVDRGVRALLIVGATLGLASLLDLDLAALASGDSFQAQLVSGAFNIAIVALLADFVWQLAKTMIDQRLALEGDGEPAEMEAGSEGGGAGASRIRTLLPLLRKFLMISLAVIVVMLVLSSLGVNIGPLLAGAGVVGLAIGFGAQTLVRDIVSGVFFLMDDAFRLGEYVDVGDVKGTVEHISVRSLRLRHHRGALHTIPFGEITHLSNYSRDWVIMKLEFRVPFDTDMQQVKKIFKRIGADMMADEELGPNLLDPPKSQGVFQMDDSAMIVRAKFMAKPGKQFVIRRELYHRVQKAFDEAGIEFARKQVSVFVPPGADPQAAAAAALASAEEAAADGGPKRAQPAG